MRKTKPGILAFLGAITLFLGCQKDDICPESSATTPLLQIEFYNAEDIETLKMVQNLTIIAVGEEDTLLGPTSTTEIAIPLRTNQSYTEYRFILNQGTENENEDLIRFDYNPSPEYVNRACGFKISFLDLTLRRDLNDDNWIQDDAVIIENIENEEATHITFTH